MYIFCDTVQCSVDFADLKGQRILNHDPYMAEDRKTSPSLPQEGDNQGNKNGLYDFKGNHRGLPLQIYKGNTRGACPYNIISFLMPEPR